MTPRLETAIRALLREHDRTTRRAGCPGCTYLVSHKPGCVVAELAAAVNAEARPGDPLGEALNSGDGSYRP